MQSPRFGNKEARLGYNNLTLRKLALSGDTRSPERNACVGHERSLPINICATCGVDDS